jgi:hypothetical protein
MPFRVPRTTHASPHGRAAVPVRAIKELGQQFAALERQVAELRQR